MRAPPPRPRLPATLVAAMLLVPLGAVFAARALIADLPSRAVTTPTSASSPPSPVELDPAAPVLTPPIHGRILDAEGNAVQGAAVRLVSPSLPYTIAADTKSGPGGTFAFARVGPEPVRVVADHDPEGAVTSAELRLDAGQTTDLTLVLSPATAVQGSVADVEEHPLAGATLFIEGVPWIAGGVVSDTAGAFRLPRVPEGVTALVAVARGYKTARVALPRRQGQSDVVVRVHLAAAAPVDGDVRDPDGNPVRARVVACEGQPSEASTVSADDGTFELPASAIGCDAVAQHDEYEASAPGALVEGRRVELRLRAGGAIEGVVVDDRGASVPSFTIGVESFIGSQSRSVRGTPARKVDDPGGSFRLEKLAPGRYVLGAGTPGKAAGRSDGVDVTAGAATTGVRIVLPAGGSVVGHVVDEHLLPLAGVDLRFDAVSSVVESSARAETDATGQYRLDGAPAGPFTLRAEKPGYRVRMISGLRVESRGTVTMDLALHAVDGGGGMEFGGIGANLTQAPDGLAFGAVFGGDPAERAGLRAGDRILAIDAETTDGLSITDALQRLRGEAGTRVGVTVRRPKTGETVDVLVERASIVR